MKDLHGNDYINSEDVIENVYELENEIQRTGATITKTYVKGRENLCTNPAIAEYNKTSTAANSTVSTLIQIIEKLSEEQVKESKLFKMMEAMGDD